MWKQSTNNQEDGGIQKEGKERVDTQVDSGFLSGSNLISSEMSIDLENEEKKEEGDSKVAPEPVKAIDSGFDLGLSKNLSDLSLKECTVNPLDSGTIDPDTEELASEELKNENAQEQWEIYYNQDEDGDTQLHISIVQGFLEAIFFLINMAPHPCLYNILNDAAQSPLHLAVLTHQPRVVRKLIIAGAEPTVQNFKGNTPLHVACSSGDLHCAKALTSPLTSAERTSMGPGKLSPSIPQNLEQRNYTGETCLHLAIINGHIELARHLLRLGADLEARDGLAGRTALLMAIEHRRREIINFLLHECRPNLEAKNYAGKTALSIADQELSKELVRLGATPSLPPEIYSDEESDEEDEEEDEEAYRTALVSLIGIDTAKSLSPVVTI